MTTTLIVPGLHSSGPDHWQTWFEQQIPGALRVVQSDWNDANLANWTSRVRRDISRNPGRIVIAAHSFGALAAVQAAYDHAERIHAVLLVAPADPEKFRVAELLPKTPLPFRTVVVASADDPWMQLAQAAHWADAWDADFINLGNAGHINASSGFGPWPEGLALLQRLRHSAALANDNQPKRKPVSAPAAGARPAAFQRAAGAAGRNHFLRRALAKTIG